MWSDLLQASDNEATPSGRLNKLSLDYDTAELPQPLSTTDTPRKRRLVDALKEAQVPSSDGLESEDGSVLDVEMEDAAADPQEPVDVAMSQQPTQAPLPAPSTGHKHTYGGSRSYLQEQAQSFEELLSQPLEDLDSPVPAQPKTSLTMRKGGGSAADEFDVSDDDTAGKGLRSIHELRAAGGRSAFQRDMEALGDELRSDNITRKRNAALDLSKKLIDGPFRGRFIQAGYGPDMLRALGSTKDPLIPVSQAVLATTLLDDNAAFVNLNACLDTTIIDSLILALAEPRDLVAIAKDRKTNMSRLAQSSVADLKAKLLNFEPLQLNGQRQVPPQSVALRALEMIVRKLRESGNLRDPFLRPAMLGKITSIMDSAIANTMTASHTELEPSDLGTALSILESCSLSPLCVADEATWTPILLTQVVESLQIVLGSDHQQSLQLLALRFTINMTNSSGRNADFFAHSQLLLALLNKVQAGLDALPSETSSSSQLDLLLLTLGCLINLVECSGAVRRTLSQDHRSQLEELIKRFVGNRKKAADADSLEATQVNIAYGYLAIFFGHCSQSAALRLLITDELPTKRLDMIIEAVEEFVKHNQETDKRAGSEAYASFTERLRSVVETLRNPDD